MGHFDDMADLWARGTYGATTNEGRPLWVVRPLARVGPLFFGMSATEVEAVLPSLVLKRFPADPFSSEIAGVQFGSCATRPAVHAYFDGDDRLCCVALDAAYGPLASLEGLSLTGLAPATVEQVLFRLAESVGHGVSYGPRGNPGIDAIGLVLRVQETREGVLSRPVIVGQDWADRCVDDAEGQIPLCEWVGRQWHYPGFPDVWPGPDGEPHWDSWRPPF